MIEETFSEDPDRERKKRTFLLTNKTRIKEWLKNHPKDKRPPVFWDSVKREYVWLSRESLRARQRMMKNGKKIVGD